MKKINLIFALLLSLMGVTQVKAEAGDYSVNFNNLTALPEGWEAVETTVGFSYGAGTYEISSDYARSGKGLYTYQTSYAGYIVTAPVTGDVSYYVRARATRKACGVKVYEYDGSTFTEIAEAAHSYTSSNTSTSWTQKTFKLTKGTRLAFQLNNAVIDDFVAEKYVQADGPALAVSGATNGALNYGMVNAGTKKSLILSNPGTESITVDITTTGGFSTDASKTIAAGGQVTLEIAAPDATATGAVTITPNPAVEGVAPVTISLSAVIKDPNKFYEDNFSALPTDWTTTGSWYFSETNGAYTTSWYLSSYSRLITPLLVISEGETFVVEAKGYSTSNTSYQHLQMQYSADGETWTNFDAEPALDPSTWNTYTFTGVPAGTYFIAINASQADVRMFYGGVLDETPRPKLEVEGIANGGSLSWGYSDVSAGTTKTITLKNDGTADLDVTIAATDDYTVDPVSATIEAGGTVVVTIGTPAHDGNGVLTITPSEESGLSPYTINLTSYYKEPKPVMSIDKTSIAFGKVNEVKSETITVSNTGDADLVVTIANDNTENFSVEPADQLIVAPGEEGNITITYNFVEGTWGTFNANVKVTPNYGGTYDVKTIAVSATSKDPNVWDEDFESGVLDQDWIASGWSISTPGTYSGGNGTKMVGGNSKTATLITPRLIATEGQQLTFELGGSSSSYPLAVEYSTDRESWTEVASFTEDGTCSIDAPVTDPTTFYLRFTGWVYIDNLNGFKLDKPEHDAAITSVSIPATGNQYVEYTASVTVKELAGKDENVNVEFYLGEDMVGEASGTLDPNGTETFEVKFTPTAPFEGVASFTVTFVSDDDEVFASFETDPVEVTIAAAPVLDETTGSLDDFENWGSYDVIELKYSLKEGWNSVILPFAWSDLSVFGEGAKAYSFDGYTNGAIDFKAVNELNGQTPYIIYAPAAKDKVVFLDVANFRTSTEAADLNVTHNGAVFQGTYAPIAAPGMQGKYGVVPSTGKIAKGGAGASLKGFRGYFELPTSANEVKANFFDEIGNLETSIGAVELQNEINGNLYDLSGRKVEGKAKAGVYIQNGKKVVVK